MVLFQWAVYDGLRMTPADVDSVLVQLRLKLPVDQKTVAKAYQARFLHFRAATIEAGRFEEDTLRQYVHDCEVLRRGLGI